MAQLVIPLATKIGLSEAVATALGTAASIGQVAVPVAGAIAGNKQAKAQAQEYSRQAREERVAASIKAERLRRENRQRQARDFTASAEAGVLSGTTLGLLDQNAVQRELDALTVEYQGEQAGQSADFQARQTRKSASPLNVFSAAIEGFNTMDPLNLSGTV